MKPSFNFSGVNGKTLFMFATGNVATLVTRTDKQMRKRSFNFANEHVALDWCLNHKTTFILLSHSNGSELN